jgi:hypothetical protein
VSGGSTIAGNHLRRRKPGPRRRIIVAACAASLAGLLVSVPGAIGSGQPKPPAQGAVDTSAAPTTLPPSTTSQPTTTRRPRKTTSTTKPVRATTSTTSGPRPNSEGASAGWINVVNDQFNSGGIPAHWDLYDGPYGSGPRSCATPRHVSVSGGAMHMLMRYEASGRCGAGWYTGGMMIDKAFGSVDQRVTVRFRVVRAGATAHHIIPMRFPPNSRWPQGGEEDYCEGSSQAGCHTFLHYGDKSTTQVMHRHVLDLSQWRTVRFERRDHVVKAYVDDLTRPVWTYRGSRQTLPDTVKQVVLQQECEHRGCPGGTTGTEDIQIDWITIDNPA